MVLGLTYDATPDQLVAFTAAVRALLEADPAARGVAVRVSELAESSINVAVGYEVVGQREAEAREQHVLAILRLASAHGLEFAYPTRTVHVVQGSA
jgi:small-conductance mechanosensitive channel